MHLLLLLLLSFHAWADIITIDREIPVYQSPADGARVLFYGRPGDTINTQPATDQYLKVKIGHKGKGYIKKTELNPLGEVEAETEWAFGGGLVFTSLQQKGKSFETSDEVQYTTSSYSSTGLAPFLVGQMGAKDFWRLTVAEKQTHYKSSASKNVPGDSTQSIDLQQTFISGLLQKAWNPAFAPKMYYGAGLELAKATAVNLKLGGSTLPTTSDDEPTYFGLQGFVGGEWSLSHSFSVYGEGRLEYIVNQSPAIYSYEVAAGLLYWL